MNTVNPNDEQITLIKETFYDTPFVMINLLKFKDKSSNNSKQLYHRYTKQITHLVQEIGAHVIFYGSVDGIFIGRQSDSWDEVLLVYYPSGKAFLQMIDSEEYKQANQLRQEALERCVLLISKRHL